MMRMQVQVTDLAVFRRGKDRWIREQKAKLLQAITEAALVVKAEAQQLILKGPKTGRVYVRRGRIRHRASAPGQAPASDTGTLVRSIAISVDARALTASIGSNVKYAPYLELGTSRMKPRPYLSTALQNKRPVILKIIAARLK